MDNIGFGYSFKTLQEMAIFLRVESIIEPKFFIMIFFGVFLFILTFYLMPFLSFKLKNYKEKKAKEERKRKIKYIAMQKEIEEEIEQEIKKETIEKFEKEKKL